MVGKGSVPPQIPLARCLFGPFVVGTRGRRRARRQPGVPGFQSRDIADEQPDHQRLRFVEFDTPARLTCFSHFRHLSCESSAVCNSLHVRRAMAVQKRTLLPRRGSRRLASEGQHRSAFRPSKRPRGTFRLGGSWSVFVQNLSATRTLKTQRSSGFAGSSLTSWMTCERTRLRPAPDLMSTWAAVLSPSEIRPSRMCSVPM